jgi:hypothetical protein
MARRKYSGICHICGIEGKLSYEHVPPESAFNDHRVVRAIQKDLFNIDWDGKKGDILQKGSGAHTLCGKCNNDTGSWYAAEYASWAKQGMEALIRIDEEDRLPFFVRFSGYPLRLLKQVITMHFSTNSYGYADKHPELVRFIMDRNSRQLPPRYKIDLVLVRGHHRSTGVYSVLNLDTRRFDIASEVAHLPFSFVLRFVDNTNDPTACERHGPIEHFADYDYDTRLSVWVQTIAGHITNAAFPGDYRSLTELRKCREESELEERIARSLKG